MGVTTVLEILCIACAVTGFLSAAFRLWDGWRKP